MTSRGIECLNSLAKVRYLSLQLLSIPDTDAAYVSRATAIVLAVVQSNCFTCSFIIDKLGVLGRIQAPVI